MKNTDSNMLADYMYKTNKIIVDTLLRINNYVDLSPEVLESYYKLYAELRDAKKFIDHIAVKKEEPSDWNDICSADHSQFIQDNHHLDDRMFIINSFINCLGRAPEEDALCWHVNEIQKLGRYDVFNIIFNSEEAFYRRKFLEKSKKFKALSIDDASDYVRKLNNLMKRNISL